MGGIETSADDPGVSADRTEHGRGDSPTGRLARAEPEPRATSIATPLPLAPSRACRIGDLAEVAGQPIHAQMSDDITLLATNRDLAVSY